MKKWNEMTLEEKKAKIQEWRKKLMHPILLICLGVIPPILALYLLDHFYFKPLAKREGIKL